MSEGMLEQLAAACVGLSEAECLELVEQCKHCQAGLVRNPRVLAAFLSQLAAADRG